MESKHPFDVDELIKWLEERYADYSRRRHESPHLHLDTRAAECGAILDKIKKMVGERNA